jgi:hypothetical protein
MQDIKFVPLKQTREFKADELMELYKTVRSAATASPAPSRSSR